MNSVTVNDVEKYLKPGGGFIVCAVLFAFMTLMFLTIMPVGAVVSAAITGLCIWGHIRAVKLLKSQLESMQSTGELDRVLQDFAAGQSVFDDNLRVGNYYLFGKKHGGVVRYGEIKQIYQHIQRTYFIETARSLQFVDVNGKTRVLCKLPLWDKAKTQVLQVMAFVQSKNPTVKLGYK